MREDVIVFDIFKDIVSKMKVYDANGSLIYLNFQAGRTKQVLKTLNDFDESSSLKNKKYPLIALFFPFVETRNESGFYSKLKIPKISISYLSDGTSDISARFSENGTFKTYLYPCYYELLKQISFNKNVIEQDKDILRHKKIDNPGVIPIAQGSTDYIDSIDILDLELTLTQTKNC
jgi:hypothetical protein